MGTPAPAPTTSTSPCKIINNTNYDLTVLSPNGIGTPDTVWPTNNGSAVIPAGKSASLLLDPTQLYNLIVCTASTLFPVANLGVSADFNTNLFADQTITQADYVGMTNAAAFQQTILACPDSQLATNYAAALTQSSAASDTTTGDQIMAKFFTSTKSYQSVSADEVTAISTYYNQYPFVWGEVPKTSVTYYLYSSNGTANSFNGTVTLSISGAINIKKPNCGYTCTFAPAKTSSDTTTTTVNAAQSKNLTYANGFFVDDPNSDTPAISLGGSFQLKSRLTQSPTDNTIITALSGKLSGTSVLGFDSAQLSTGAQSSPTTWQDIVSQAMSGLGDLVTFICLGQLAWGAKKWIQKKYNEKYNPKAKEMTVEERLEAIQKETAEANQKLTKQVEGLNDKLGIKDPATSPKDALANAGKSSDTVSALGQKSKLQDAIDSDAESLEDMAKSEGEMTSSEISSLNSSESKLREINTELKSPTADVSGQVKAQTSAFKEVHTEIKTLSTNVSERLSTATQKSLSESQAETEEVLDNLDKVDTQAKEVEDGDVKPSGEGEMGELGEAGEALGDLHGI